MRKCFEFSTHAEGDVEEKMHELPNGRAVLDLCEEMRQAGKTGFLVRAKTAKEARQRLTSLSPALKNVETVYIL